MDSHLVHVLTSTILIFAVFRSINCADLTIESFATNGSLTLETSSVDTENEFSQSVNSQRQRMYTEAINFASAFVNIDCAEKRLTARNFRIGNVRYPGLLMSENPLIAVVRIDGTSRMLMVACNDNMSSSQRFHPNHAHNIVLEENGLVAHRTADFNNGFVFSERYLYPGEFFVVEIEQNETQWFRGYLRLGLTLVNPAVVDYSSDDSVGRRGRQGLFDLRPPGSTWLFRLTELLLDFDGAKELAWPYELDTNKVDVRENCIRTCWGSYARIPLSLAEESDEKFSKLEVGFKVGVVYIPYDENSAELYYLVNGNVFGPFARDIPYRQSPVFAVADLFGRTKKIKVLPLRCERTLKQLCRMTILRTHDMQKVKEMNLPKSIVNYLNFNPVSSII